MSLCGGGVGVVGWYSQRLLSLNPTTAMVVLLLGCYNIKDNTENLNAYNRRVVVASDALDRLLEVMSVGRHSRRSEGCILAFLRQHHQVSLSPTTVFGYFVVVVVRL